MSADHVVIDMSGARFDFDFDVRSNSNAGVEKDCEQFTCFYCKCVLQTFGDDCNCCYSIDENENEDAKNANNSPV